MRKPTRLEKVPEELLRVIQDAMQVRVSKKLEPVGRKWQNYPRYMRAISRHESMKRDLKESKFIDDECGQANTFGIFQFMIIAFVAVLFFGGLIYAQGLIYNVLHQTGVDNDKTNSGNQMYVNMTQAADITFGTVNNSIQALRMVALVYILGYAALIIVTNALQKIHPIWFFAYILISVLAVIFSVPIANAYYSILGSGIYDGGLNNFTGANWVLLNLPIIVMVISVVGAVFLFINLIRTQDAGTMN